MISFFSLIGTPGTGKSTLSSELSQLTGMEWINVGDLAKANNLYEEYDETLQCHVLDEDGVMILTISSDCLNILSI